MMIAYRTCRACSWKQEESWPYRGNSSTVCYVSRDMWLPDQQVAAVCSEKVLGARESYGNMSNKETASWSRSPNIWPCHDFPDAKLVVQRVAFSNYCHGWRRDGGCGQWTGQTDELGFARRVTPRQTIHGADGECRMND